MSVVSRKSLLEAGAHFGHKKANLDSRMKRFIFGVRAGVHIIDLEITTRLINQAYDSLKKIAANGKVIFVGTKKQSADIVKFEAERCGAFYVNNRWLGGTLTNHATIRRSVETLKKMEATDPDTLSAKEQSVFMRKKNKLEKNLSGIKEMYGLPVAMFVIDVEKDAIAVLEANKLGIPVFAIVDTNVNPTNVNHPIPANDDATRSVSLVAKVMADAVIAANKVEEVVVLEKIEEEAVEELAEEKAAHSEEVEHAKS